MTNQEAKDKLARAQRRGYYRSIDLFAGCGGLTLGFHRAGFRCISAVELDDEARNSHIANFGPESSTYRAHADITRTSPAQAVAHLGGNVDEAVDVVIGGPPCQAFSRLGRAALWRLAGKNQAHGDDHRATMYEYFLEYVAQLRPLAFVMENVREIGKHVGKNIAEEIAINAEELGYDVRYTLLNAAWFGVPQFRERAFVIGIHKGLATTPSFPLIERKCDLPVGYSTARAGTGHIEFLKPFEHYVDHFSFAPSPKPAVSAAEAFSDLPKITYHLDGRKGKGVPRNPDEQISYSRESSAFADEMRNWPEFSNGGKLSGHVIRFTPRDYETFRRMPHGGMYPEALATAEAIFSERLKALEKAEGRKIPRGSKLWRELRRATVPPYKAHRYPNKFRKMWPDAPARTVPAHIGKDAYSHIHFDSAQARGISMREAARLQSFPDAFALRGSMNSRLRQIGNAVPPLLAFAVARQLAASLRKTKATAQPPKIAETIPA